MYDEVMDKYGFIPANHIKPIDFEVLLNGIYDKQGRRIPGHKAVVRGDTGDTLAVHSDKYSLVPYQVHFDAFEKAIDLSGLDKTGLRIGTDLTNNGARIFRQYLFPAHMVKFDSRYHGERSVALRIVMFDSYDGSSKFRGMAGGFDFVCANESVSGKEIDAIGFKHVGDMETKIADAADRLTGSAERFIEEMNRLQHWPKIGLKSLEFSELVAALPQSNNTLVDAMTAEFARHNGVTLWDAYNLLTRWATHSIPPKTKADRQKRVGELVEGELWQGLERVG
jgi:Domain of unknown function (DUF932)